MGMYCQIYAATEAEAKKLKTDPDNLGQILAKAPSVRLEKSWHGLHYLLTGSSYEGKKPLNFLLAEAIPLGDSDPEDGPPRLFPPDAVQQVDDALRRVTDETLWSRFDPEAMESEDIYPGIWDEHEEDLKEEYLMYFNQLKKFVHAAREKGNAMVISIG